MSTLLSPKGSTSRPFDGIDPLVDVDVDAQVDIFQTGVALAMNPGINAARNGQHPISLPELELHANRLGKDHSFEGLDRYLVSDHHSLATTGKKPADIDLM